MTPQPRYQPGDRIGGRYQVHKALMGGMGEVYLCLDLETNYPYALKTFQHHYLTQAQGLRRAFEQEVATWVALEKHPNIVRCFWMQILDNQPFMCLEWIAGEEGKGTDLRGWLRHGPLGLKLALEIAIDICNGLIHAQVKQPGLVHRDLKPENILMAQGGLAKITDFGLVHIVAEAGLQFDDVTATTKGRQSLVGEIGIVGTPAYMAPEQWRGEALDARTDIYALGCMLYEMVTGRRPFGVDFTPTIPQQLQMWLQSLRIAHEADPRPRLPEALAPALDALMQRVLAKKPADRPASQADLLAQLCKLYQQQINQSPPARSAQSEFTAVDYNNRGNTYHALQQYEAALADFGRAIDLDSNYSSAYSNRGATYHDLDQYHTALADFDCALDLDPKYAPAYSNRGLIRYKLQEYERALVDYNQAIIFNPNFAHPYFNRGNVYAALGKYEQAVADYDKAIALDPNEPLVYYNRGLTYAKLQEYKQALASYDKAIALDPDSVNTYLNRGNMYHILQEYERALADYDKAIALDPNSADIYFNRGVTHHELQEYERALADYDKAIALDSNFIQVYSNRGNSYSKLQKYEQALVDYDKAIALDSNSANTYLNRGNVYRILQKYERALADYDKAIALDPNSADIYFNRGVTHHELQEYERALADYDKAIVLDPNDAITYSNRGNIYTELQEYKRALADCDQAITLDSKFAQAYINKGVVLYNQGLDKEALSLFEQAAQLGEPIGTQYAIQIRQVLGW